MALKRVVVTGYGMITPLGHNAPATWEGITAGRSGVAPITLFDTSRYLVKIAAEVKNFDPAAYMPAKEARRRDRYQQFAMMAAMEALQCGGLTLETHEQRQRMGVFVGSSVGGVTNYFEQAMLLFETGDPRRVSPFGIPMLMVDGGSDMISIEIGAMGPSYTLASACATGADCIGHAFDQIRLGRIDQALAGAGEAPIIPIGAAAFDRIGACSRDNDTPEQASRPFSKDRTGFVLSEGAGVLLLEELETAQARGATIYAELVGYGVTSDAFHITAPHPEGLGAINAMRAALHDAQVNTTDIHYINAHGTATQLNDAMETKAVKQVFGERAYHIPLSSTKSMTGHGMGMTAAIEAIFTVLSIRDNVAPPTTNLREPDPECDLDYVPHQARSMQIDCAMSNSFGFGGHNSSLIFKQFVS
ncbi:MAG: beta-ketoacyl-ACP synthase II [Armatimonadetes bacterium]|nr:beta-ketoacyl-ACP synthase II [Anaerolineae bacterium]